MYSRIPIVISLFLLICTGSYGQYFSLGGGLEYNITTENPGLNLRGYYNIGDHFCFGPEFSYSFPKTERIGGVEEDTSVFEMNFNAHYIFELFEERIGAYPVFGINYTIEDIEKTELETRIVENETEQFLGANIGGGFHIPFNNFSPFFEYHYITGELGEHVFTAGILYTFKKKEHKP